MPDDLEDPGDDEARDATGALSDRPVRPTCPGCGYDLTGTLEAPEQRCPECGRAWTIEELAIQHAAMAGAPSPASRALGVITPGLTVGGLLLIGLLFGPPITWLTLPAAAILVVLATWEWARDLHRQSFKRARSRLGRFVYVAGLTALLVAFNIVVVTIGGMLLLVVITSCGWMGRS